MMKLTKIAGIVTAVFWFSTTLSFAGATSGCGPGYLLFKGQKGFGANLSVMVTNYSSGSQTFAITSGTSGCNPDDVVKAEYEAEVFVKANFDKISEEMSQGQGLFLSSYSKLLNCQADTFNQVSQQQYDDIFTDTATPQQVLQNTQQLIEKDPKLQGVCL